MASSVHETSELAELEMDDEEVEFPLAQYQP